MALRFPAVRAACVLVAGTLALAACSLLPGGTDKADTTRGATKLASTAWTVAPPSKVAKGGTLRLAVTALPPNFNPQLADGADASTTLGPTLGNAIRVTADGGWRVDPDYATSVKVTDTSPLTISVRLNRRAVWEGGTHITSKDMVAFWRAQNGSKAAFNVSSTAGYEDISAVKPHGLDAYSVVFKKSTADWPLYVYPRLPANVSSDPRRFNSGFRTRAIPANGPFRVSSIDASAGTVTETPNPLWWGSAPRLAKIVWRVASSDVQAKAYAANQLDAVDVEAGTYDTVKGHGNIQYASGLEWTQLTLNGARGPLKDVNVRRAIAHAINRAEIAKRSAADFGAPGSLLGSVVYVPGQRGYGDSARSIAYDPKVASRLLAKAGYSKAADGTLQHKGKQLRLSMPVPTDTPTNLGRSRRIAADLAKVGITVKLKSVPAAKFFDHYIVPLDFDIVTFTWRGSPFPVSAAEPLFYPVDSAQNFTGLADDSVGAAWDKAKATLDESTRFARVRALDARILHQVPIIPIAMTPIVVAVRNGVLNYGASQFEQPDWTRVGFTPKKK